MMSKRTRDALIAGGIALFTTAVLGILVMLVGS